MTEQQALDLAARLTAETGVETRPVHFHRGHDGWAVAAYLDGDADSDPIVITRKEGQEDYCMVEFRGGHRHGHPGTADDVAWLIRARLTRPEDTA